MANILRSEGKCMECPYVGVAEIGMFGAKEAPKRVRQSHFFERQSRNLLDIMISGS